MSSPRKARDWFIRGSELGLQPFPAIDFQMHTQWTDGRSSVAEMIAAAADKGLQAIAITEHVNAGSAWYQDFVADVKAARRGTPDVSVYFGAEIAAADYRGGMKADRAQLEAELVLGVVHRLPKQDGSGFWNFEELTRPDAIELEMRALTGLATNGSIDVLGHPGGTVSKKFGAFPVEWMESAFCAAREHGVAVELNTKYVWDPAGMLALLRRVDPLVSFGSDAHSAAEVGSNVAIHSQIPMPAATP